MVNLSGLPSANTGALRKVQIITQVARTVIGVSGVERIRLRSNGMPWDLWTMQGGIVNRLIDYRALLGFYGVDGFIALP